jgi:2-polyprenyl-3-methyl-5-hydroxy-6-metoxy-1,4-benzoquinol methylase
MQFTGERPLDENELYSSRLRYKTILPYCFGKNVLDFGCGVGHGSYFLSNFCNQVIGYDKSVEAIEEARKNIPQKLNLAFVLTIPTFLEKLNLINSCEVIEHIEKDDLLKILKIFCELCNTFVGTTPNGDLLYYQPQTIAERRGFHLWHYTYEQLYNLLSQFYKYVEIQGHAFDPNLKTFTGYTFYASNEINWNNYWFKKLYPEEIL